MKSKLVQQFELLKAEEIRELKNKLVSVNCEIRQTNNILKILEDKKTALELQINMKRKDVYEMNLDSVKTLEIKDKWEGRRRPTGCK